MVPILNKTENRKPLVADYETNLLKQPAKSVDHKPHDLPEINGI